LPVTCLGKDGDANAGDGVTGVIADNLDVSFIRSGELSVTQYAPPDFDGVASNIVGNFAAGVTTIKLVNTSNFPPENGKIVINPSVPASKETLEYSYNNVTTGELYLKSPTANPHSATETVERVDWVEVNSTVAPGSYLLLLPPSILNKEDIFTYIVTNISGGGGTFEPYFNTIDIVGSTDPVTFTPPSVQTCKLYGFVLDLAGKPVINSSLSARLLSVPAMLNNAAFEDTVVTAKTDANGYFEISVVQKTTVQVVIPDIGYSRTITVPVTTLAKLFELS
jgi:hypothetical protein